MIHIERIVSQEFSDAFDIWASEEKAKAKEFFFSATKQERYEFTYNGSFVGNIVIALMNMSKNKCAFCESSIDIKAGNFELGLFRPNSIYWWLAYEWLNMLPTCIDCNSRFKGVQFPVRNSLPPSTLQEKTIAQLNKIEEPLLIDPFKDDPVRHFGYQVIEDKKAVVMRGLTERGVKTIEVLSLNRENLGKSRYEAYKNVFIELPKKSLKSYSTKKHHKSTVSHTHLNYAHNESYLGMLRYFFSKNELKKTNVRRQMKKPSEYDMPATHKIALPPTINTKTASIAPLTINKFIPCSVEIKNFKSIDILKFSFRSFDENKADAKKRASLTKDVASMAWESWILLLGENGVGKSSVLQAIILTLLPDIQRKQLIENPMNLIRKGETKGHVEIKLGDGGTIRMDFNNKGKVTGNIKEFNDYLLAYGSTRLLPKKSLQPERKPGKVKVKNFFDYTVALENAEQWLHSLSEDDFNQAALFLKDLLFLTNNLTRRNNLILTQEHGHEVDISQISDGYKTLLALAVDMLKTFTTQESDSRYRDVRSYASGIVLIDELGTHLHPRWKMQIVERLRNALPNIFFIVTTHEPLCLRGLRNKEVIVLQQDPVTKIPFPLTDLPSPDGLRVDQLLTSKYFGLNSTMDPATELKFERYYKLLAIPETERIKKEQHEIDDLQEELKELKQLGATTREELFYYVVDEVIANNTRKNGIKQIGELKKEVKDKIEELLKDIEI